MATYNLKYYAEIQNFRGQFARVEILQRSDSAFSVLEIGDVCGLVLEIQGNQEDVFSPIVKTQARLSMLSCDDKPTADGVKYGGWSEFYTSDSTLYKMVIKTKPNASAANWTTRWTGYITPDSWREGLEYRGSITITARDNIGHLQDFEFDGTGDTYGLASIRSILAAAMEKINFPMAYNTTSAPEYVQADGVSVLDAMVLVHKFSGEDWFSVIEELLDSIGYTLRFTDNNTFTLAPMRYLPLLGESREEDQRTISDLEFFGGEAEVVPAAKKIIDTHTYEYNGEVAIPIMGEFTYQGVSYYEYRVFALSRLDAFPMSGSAPYRKLASSAGTVWQNGSDLWQPGSPSVIIEAVEGDSWANHVFLPANGVEGNNPDTRTQTMSFPCGTPDVTLRFSFNRYPATMFYNESDHSLDGVWPLVANLFKIEYKVKYELGNTVRWWDGTDWVDTETKLQKDYDENASATELEVQLGPCVDIPENGRLTFYFTNIQYMLATGAIFTWRCTGCYARLSSATVEPNLVNLSKNTVTTINDDKYNILINRTPAVSPLSREVPYVLPSNYETALFYYPAGETFPEQFPYMANWSGVSGGVTKPIPVLIHQQILCYRGASLWQLSGECAPKNKDLLYFDTLLHYKNRTYMIQSGTIDFTTGTINGVLLREFLEYDDIWDDTQEGDWSDESVYNTVGGEVSRGSGHSGGMSSVGSGGINFFEVDAEHTFASGKPAIKLKDVYAGLWSPGFMAQFGVSETEGVSGVTLENVWKSLMNTLADHTYDNSEIAKQHLAAIWQLLAESSNNVIHGSHLPMATTQALGGVKVDGASIFIDNNGVISGFAGGGLNGLTAPKKIILCTSYPASMDADAIYLKVEASS